MNNRKFTLVETLKLWEMHALLEELNESPKINDTEDSYTHDYDDYISSTAKNVRSSIFRLAASVEFDYNASYKETLDMDTSF